MGIFSSIWDRITGHRPRAAPSAAAPQAAPAAAPTAAAAPVDVEAVLQSMAELTGAGEIGRAHV